MCGRLDLDPKAHIGGGSGGGPKGVGRGGGEGGLKGVCCNTRSLADKSEPAGTQEEHKEDKDENKLQDCQG